jgi:hypothetical protein
LTKEVVEANTHSVLWFVMTIYFYCFELSTLTLELIKQLKRFFIMPTTAMALWSLNLFIFIALNLSGFTRNSLSN